MNNKQKNSRAKGLKIINKKVAGIDIGSTSHFVAISAELSEKHVREFSSFTCDLKEAAKWLKEHGITSVAMESTGVYWVAFYEVLEEAGFEVLLVNSQHVKNVPGRKSDVLDCQWIQQLHSYGLLRGSFRPEGEYCTLRGMTRQRETIIREVSKQQLRMQKALTQMNINLHNVISDISGPLGIAIIKEMIRGNRNAKALSELRVNDSYKNSKEVIEKSLEGNYRDEHMLSLKQAYDSYEFYHIKLKECDEEIEKILARISNNTDNKQVITKKKKDRRNGLHFIAREKLIKITEVDLTKIDRLNEHSVLRILGEVGTNMNKWKTEKHFASWLGLAPGTKISGGKKLSSSTKKCKNRAAHIFRLAANTLSRSKSALGAFLRRKKAQIGKMEAITATAHKIAKIFYRMLKLKVEYKDLGSDYYEKKYQDKILKNITRKALLMGYELIKTEKILH